MEEEVRGWFVIRVLTLGFFGGFVSDLSVLIWRPEKLRVKWCSLV